MRNLLIALTIALLTVAITRGDERSTRAAWILSGLKEYKQMDHAQYAVVRNGRPYHEWFTLTRDDVTMNSFAANPNRLAPWKVSGGMEGLRGWSSLKLTNVDKRDVFLSTMAVPIANAGRALPVKRWSFPDGAVFADVLSNNRGQIFEIRTRTKRAGKWTAKVEFTNSDHAPAGYMGAGKRCAECHDFAGSSQQYGIMVRGDDTVFSFNPFH